MYVQDHFPTRPIKLMFYSMGLCWVSIRSCFSVLKVMGVILHKMAAAYSTAKRALLPGCPNSSVNLRKVAGALHKPKGMRSNTNRPNGVGYRARFSHFGRKYNILCKDNAFLNIYFHLHSSNTLTSKIYGNIFPWPKVKVDP